MSRTQAEHLTCMATKFELDYKHAQFRRAKRARHEKSEEKERLPAVYV